MAKEKPVLINLLAIARYEHAPDYPIQFMTKGILRMGNGDEAVLEYTESSQDEETGEIEEIDLGLVGEIKKINPEILEIYTENDFIPVISPIGIADDGTTLNLNADTVAGAIAGEIDAEKLIILTDVPGVLRDPEDPSSLIQRIHVDEIPSLIEEGVITGGMIPKIETCVDALNNGVNSAHILDGRLKHTLLLEIFTKEGIGTMIYK